MITSLIEYLLDIRNFFLFFFLAAPVARGSSQARDGTHATEATGDAVVTTLDP